MALDDQLRDLAQAVGMDVGQLTDALTDKIGSDTVSTMWAGTRAEFDGLGEPDPGTVYLITEG